jgi:hypothetical protein
MLRILEAKHAKTFNRHMPVKKYTPEKSILTNKETENVINFNYSVRHSIWQL